MSSGNSRRRPKQPAETLSAAARRAAAAAPALRERARRYALAHYRAHRRLPARPALIGMTELEIAFVLVRGDFEHRLGIAAALLRIASIRCRLIQWVRSLKIP